MFHSMLLLVLADNFLVVFAAGARRPVELLAHRVLVQAADAAIAAKKAFIVIASATSVALGIIAIWTNTGTLKHPRLAEKLAELNTTTTAWSS